MPQSDFQETQPLSPALRRQMTLAACSVAALCLTAVVLLSRVSEEKTGPAATSGKFASRIDGAALEQQNLRYAPQDLAALASIKSFTPTAGWTEEKPKPAAQPAAHAQPAGAARVATITPPKPTPRPKFTPPTAETPTPVALALSPAPEPSVVEKRARIAGVDLPKFVPTTDEVLDKASGAAKGAGKMIVGLKDKVGEKINALNPFTSRAK